MGGYQPLYQLYHYPGLTPEVAAYERALVRYDSRASAEWDAWLYRHPAQLEGWMRHRARFHRDARARWLAELCARLESAAQAREQAQGDGQEQGQRGSPSEGAAMPGIVEQVRAVWEQMEREQEAHEEVSRQAVVAFVRTERERQDHELYGERGDVSWETDGRPAVGHMERAVDAVAAYRYDPSYDATLEGGGFVGGTAAGGTAGTGDAADSWDYVPDE